MFSLDLDDAFLSAPCPRCGYEVEFSFLQARLQEIVICPCCKCNIQLVDEEASVEVSKREVDESLSKLERSLRGLDRSFGIEL